MVLFAVFPGSFVLSYAYAEALLIVLAAVCLWFLLDERWLLAGVAAALATATRPNGVALIAACAVAAFLAIRRSRDWWSLIAPLLAPIGFVAFQLFLVGHTDESWPWFRVQREAWREGTSFGVTAISNTLSFLGHPLASPTDALTAASLAALGARAVVSVAQAPAVADGRLHRRRHRPHAAAVDGHRSAALLVHRVPAVHQRGGVVAAPRPGDLGPHARRLRRRAHRASPRSTALFGADPVTASPAPRGRASASSSRASTSGRPSSSCSTGSSRRRGPPRSSSSTTGRPTARASCWRRSTTRGCACSTTSATPARVPPCAPASPRSSAEYVIVQDADLEYDPTEYGVDARAAAKPGCADVVFGSRFLSGRPHRVLYFWHSLGNRLLTLLSNMFTNLNLTDMETCFKAFRREVLDTIVIEEDRFGFEPEITAKVARGGWRIYEVGISYAGRTYAEGKKIGWRDGVRALVCIVRYSPAGDWIPRRARSRIPQRVTSSIDSTTMRAGHLRLPERRSANTMGVSITRKPPRTSRRTSSVRKA